jgi:hypothetical protein
VKRNIGRRRKERENKSKQQANISFFPLPYVKEG